MFCGGQKRVKPYNIGRKAVSLELGGAPRGGLMGHQVATAMPKPDRFWDLYSKYYDAILPLMPYRKLLWDAYDALDLAPGMKVLDAGCGTGNFEAFISEKNPPRIEIVAVDFSASMLAVAREKCRLLDWVSFSLGNLNTRLPYPDDSFDCIVSIHVMYALEDWDETMHEFLRVRKPHGVMVLTSSAPDFRAGPLIADHIRRIRNIWGFSRKVRSLVSAAWVWSTSGVAAAMLNIFVIDRREAQGRYLSLDKAAVCEFLERNAPRGLDSYDVGLAMAGQNFFARATKAATA